MRLHRAALDLIEGTVPVARIASRAGYGSQAAFTRAFRAAYGTPPAAYRAASSGRFDGAVTIRHTGAHRRDGPRARRRLRDDRRHLRAAPRHRDRPRLDRCGDALLRHLLRRSERHAGARAALGCVPHAAAWVDAGGDAELRPLTIAAGAYAILRHVGPYAELHRAYTWLYREWLPASGHEPADRPCVEEYLNDPRTTPAAALQTEIWLPLLLTSRPTGANRRPPDAARSGRAAVSGAASTHVLRANVHEAARCRIARTAARSRS